MIGCEEQSERSLIAYDLTTRATAGGQVDIVLHLFREGICVVTKPLHTVGRKDLGYVLSRCRISLAGRGFSQFKDEGEISARPARRAA